MKTLDLHGVTHEDAKIKVMRFIDRHYVQGDQLKIITGHSQEMRDIVILIASKIYHVPYKVGGPLGVDRSFIMINCDQQD